MSFIERFLLSSLMPSIMLMAAVSFALDARAAQANAIEMGLATISHGLGRVVRDDAGDENLLGTTYFNFDFQTHLELGTSTGFFFSPAIVWMPDFLLPRKESGVATSFFILETPFTLNLPTYPAFDFSGGLAFVNYEIKGDGGTTTLNNGNSTSTFAVPGETRSARTFGLLMGASWTAPVALRFGLDTMTEGLLSNGKRTFSLLFHITYCGLQF